MFSTTLAFFSVMTLGILVNCMLARWLPLFTIFFYVAIYTMGLKCCTARS